MLDCASVPSDLGKLDVFGLSDPGRVRGDNEDAFGLFPEQGLFVVADGMGGHAGGAVAASLVVRALPVLLAERLASIRGGSGKGMGGGAAGAVARALRETLAALSAEMRSQTASSPDLAGMGATVVAVYARSERAYVVHLGDGRAYRYRARKLARLTEDHSVVAMLLADGEIDEHAARNHPARGVVSRYVGMPHDAVADVRPVRVRSGDRLILCSDGLTDMLDDATLERILAARSEAEAACRTLVAAANDAGGRDNVTVVVLRWPEPGERENGAPPGQRPRRRKR